MRLTSFSILAVLTLLSMHGAVEADDKHEITPLSIPGSEPHVFRKMGDVELRLHVVKPKGWTPEGRRPCMVSFFGGGWINGTPESSIRWSQWAASQGLVGIAPDYRTRSRFKAVPEDCVSDGRAAMRWIVAHASELGIDTNKLVVSGGSAGGHVAAWTAITKPGPGKDDPAPTILPAALVLLYPVTDTKASGYGGPKRFNNSVERALACSVPDQMQAHVPPMIILHGDADKTVPYANSVAMRDKLVAEGNRCELVTFAGLGHSYTSSQFGSAGKAADVKTKADILAFLTSLGILGGQ
ncbi:MAG: alpha/beta hydrolase [Verrucomicrobiaceae bacterium]|nr:alpha/beta hydrolase [Verrucomicrobiaceae bacterium]